MGSFLYYRLQPHILFHVYSNMQNNDDDHHNLTCPVAGKCKRFCGRSSCVASRCTTPATNMSAHTYTIIDLKTLATQSSLNRHHNTLCRLEHKAIQSTNDVRLLLFSIALSYSQLCSFRTYTPSRTAQSIEQLDPLKIKIKEKKNTNLSLVERESFIGMGAMREKEKVLYKNS